MMHKCLVLQLLRKLRKQYNDSSLLRLNNIAVKQVLQQSTGNLALQQNIYFCCQMDKCISNIKSAAHVYKLHFILLFLYQEGKLNMILQSMHVEEMSALQGGEKSNISWTLWKKEAEQHSTLIIPIDPPQSIILSLAQDIKIEESSSVVQKFYYFNRYHHLYNLHLHHYLYLQYLHILCHHWCHLYILRLNQKLQITLSIIIPITIR